jgi:hypothetical protein
MTRALDCPGCHGTQPHGHDVPLKDRCPVSVERRRKLDRELWRNGRKLKLVAQQLLRGDQIRSVNAHHRAMAHILGPRPKGMTVSRTCPDDCPQSWVGYGYHEIKRDYRLCVPGHYVYESLADNLRRKKA